MAYEAATPDKVRPNLFIVGAPKSGTTAVYTYLRQHPDVYMCPLKEPYYFGQDLLYHRLERRTRAEYLALFADARGEAVIGEASVTYLLSVSAAGEIRAFCPEAKIVIILRNPVEMVYALHSQLLFTQVENLARFEDALGAEEERKSLERIPEKCTIVNFLFYREFANYSAQVERYLSAFGPDQVKIIIFDDFKADTARTYRDLLHFLGVDSGIEPQTYAVINRNKVRRAGWFRAASQHPLIRGAGRKLIPSRTQRQRIGDKLSWITVQHESRPPLDEEIRRDLQRSFLPEVERLSALLRRDLTYWCRSS